MRIEKAKIEGFGKFKNAEFSFNEGMNLIYGQNESGKTTLAHLLLYSLSGFTKEEVEKYKPWGGGTLGGQVDVVKQSGETITLSLDPALPSQEKLLKRHEYEATSFIPEEGGLNITEGLDGVLLARLRKRMEEMEHIERVVELLSKEQKLYDELVAKEKELAVKIETLEEEIKRVKSRIEEEKNLRKRYAESREKLLNLEKQLENLEAQLQAARVLKARKIWQDMDKLRIEISSLGVEISNLKKYTRKSDEDIEKVRELRKREAALSKEIRRYEKDLGDRREEAAKLRSRIAELEKDLSIETEEDAERIGLKVKNLELSLRMYEDKLKPKGFDEKWKVFESVPNVEDRIDRIKEMLANIKQVENDLEKVKTELAKLDNEIKFSQLRFSMRKFLAVVFVALAGGLIAVGFLTNLLFLLAIIASVSAGISLALFISTSEYKKSKNTLESEKMRLELNQRVLEKKLEGLKTDLTRLVESMGFETHEELLNEFRLYERWKLESRRMIESEEVRLIEQELIKGLSEFYEEVQGSYRELVDVLKEKVDEYTKLREKLGMLNMTMESLEARLAELKRTREEVLDEYEKLLRKLECESYEECEEIVQKKLEYEELIKKREKLEEMLKELKDKWEYYKAYQDLEVPEGVETENLPQEEILTAKIDNTRSELEATKKRLEEMERELEEKRVKPEELFSKLEEVERLRLKHSLYVEAVRVFPEVMRIFQEIKTEFVEKYKVIFEEKFQKFVDKLIKNSTFRLIVRDDLGIEISLAPGKSGHIDSLSRATRDQIELAYKLALYETLSPDEHYPLIIDNALVRYDEERLKEVLRLLKEISQERQVIIFTSDDRIFSAFPKEEIRTI